jgi:hypothetical protein
MTDLASSSTSNGLSLASVACGVLALVASSLGLHH